MIRQELQEREIRKKLLEILKDKQKVEFWLNTPNPYFGNIKPLNLIKIDRGHKVLGFINNVIEGNLP